MSWRLPVAVLFLGAAFWAISLVLVCLPEIETPAWIVPQAGATAVLSNPGDGEGGGAPVAVPEPATLILLGVGVVVAVAIRRRK
jgi:hypothetical protein